VVITSRKRNFDRATIVWLAYGFYSQQRWVPSAHLKHSSAVARYSAAVFMKSSPFPNCDFGVAGGSPSDFEKFISDETQKWSKVIKTANIKPE
jgi:hypothetical protein